MLALWIVVLEVAGAPSDRPALVDAIERMVQRLADSRPVALYDDDRYAIQIDVEAASSGEALALAQARWRVAAEDAGLPSWEIVRVEIVTSVEFDRDTEVAASDDTSTTDLWLRQLFEDALTRLPTASVFMEHLAVALDGQSGDADPAAVLLFDIDGLGALNEVMGRPGGDEVLVGVGTRIISAVGPGDLAARVDGNNFAVLRRNTSAEDALALARRIVRRISLPMTVHGTQLSAAATVGIAVSTREDTPEDLLRNADRALCAAKRAAVRAQLFEEEHLNEPGGRVDIGALRVDRASYAELVAGARCAVDGTNDLADAAAIVLRQLCAHTGWSAGHLSVALQGDGEPDVLVPTETWWSSDATRVAKLRAAVAAVLRGPGTGAAGRALVTGRVSWDDELDTNIGDALRAAGLESTIAVPVVLASEVVAVLSLFGCGPAPDDEFSAVLASVGHELGRAVRQRRCRAASTRAELTDRPMSDFS